MGLGTYLATSLHTKASNTTLITLSCEKLSAAPAWLYGAVLENEKFLLQGQDEWKGNKHNGKKQKAWISDQIRSCIKLSRFKCY